MHCSVWFESKMCKNRPYTICWVMQNNFIYIHVVLWLEYWKNDLICRTLCLWKVTCLQKIKTKLLHIRNILNCGEWLHNCEISLYFLPRFKHQRRVISWIQKVWPGDSGDCSGGGGGQEGDCVLQKVRFMSQTYTYPLLHLLCINLTRCTPLRVVLAHQPQCPPLTALIPETVTIYYKTGLEMV